jgi:hypothetical protein
LHAARRICDTGGFMPLRLVLFALALVAPGFTQTNPLPARETLSYNIEWRLVTAGKAHLTWQQTQSGWDLDLQVQSVGLVSKLFRVDDDYRAVLNRSLCTESAHLISHEGNRARDTRITFDPETHKAAYLERDLTKNTVLRQTEIEIPGCVHDVVSGLYYLRTLNLEPGQSSTMAVSDGKKSVMAKVEAQQREDISTDAGTFHTIRYEAYLFNDVLYKRPAHLYFWLTDDRRRLPVQIRVRMQITIGTITLQLEKVE